MSFTDAQIEHAVKRLFLKYDTDGNGVLDRDELVSFLTEAYQSLGKRHSTYEEVDKLIKKYDQNGDGAIDEG